MISANKGIVLSFVVNLSLTKSFTCEPRTQHWWQTIEHFICPLTELIKVLLRFHISGGLGDGTYCEFDSFLGSNTYKLRNQTCRTRYALIRWQQLAANARSLPEHGLPL